jgi:hypothetical protein
MGEGNNLEENNIINKLIENLIKLPQETEWVEFKKDNYNPYLIGEYISALSNSACLHDKAYGYLLFGIENKTHKVIGTKFKPKECKKGNEELESWLLQKLQPRIDFKIIEHVFNNMPIVIFKIDPTYNTPIKFDNVAYIRVGTYKKKLSENPEKERKIWKRLDISVNNISNNSIKEEWILNQQNIAFSHKNKKLGYMEYIITLPGIKEKFDLKKLRDAANKAITVRESFPYNWIFDEAGNNWPIPINQGIVSEPNQDDKNNSNIYLYFAIKNDGTIYFLNSLEEDWEDQGKYLQEIACIKRITENLIFSSNFYSNLGISFNSKYFIRIKYGNLHGRKYLFYGQHIFYGRNKFQTKADEFPCELKGVLKDINKENLTNLVENSVNGLFELFNYFKEEKSVISECTAIYMDKWKFDKKT